MKKNEEIFSSPTRQSIIAIVLIIYRYLRIIIRQVWPLLILFIVGRSDRLKFYLLIILAIIGLISMIWAVLAYFKFYFYIKDDELIIEKGILQRTKLNIPFDRIQTVNFQQNIIHQLLQVIQFEIDTAGSKGNEFKFDALSQPKAEALRSILLSKRGAINESRSEEYQTPEISEELILNLNPLDLLKIGVSQNHFRSIGLILLFFLWIRDSLDDLGFETDPYVEQLYNYGIDAGLIILIVVGLLVLFISFLISLVRTVIQYFDLKFWRSGSKFKLVAGLFTRREQSALDQKIQILQWGDNPIKRLFKIFDVQLKQASSVEVGARRSIRIPGCFKHQINYLKDTWLGSASNLELKLHPISIYYFYRRALYLSLVAIGGGLISWYMNQSFWVWFFLFLWVYFIYSSWLAFKKRKYGVNEQLLSVRKGMFGDHHAIMPLYKVQSVTIRQNYYQQRRDLASVLIFTASGNLTVPYISTKDATRLKNYLLFKVEKSKQKWM